MNSIQTAEITIDSSWNKSKAENIVLYKGDSNYLLFSTK